MDLETTGSSAAQDAILEIGAVRFAGGRATAEWSTFVDPGRPIPPFIRQLTGISDRMVRGAPGVEQALAGLRSFVGQDLLVAHNAAFDVGFLAANGWDRRHPVLDSLELFRVCHPDLQGHGLAAAATRYGLEFQHHRAGEDARVTAQLVGILRDELRAEDPALLTFVAQLLDGLEDHPLAATLQAAARLSPTGELWQPHPPRWEFPLPPALGIAVDAATALEDGSPLVLALGLERRESQRELLQLVDETLHQGGVLVAEAPTGTGKSLAYLLPAMAFALQGDTKVVISTGTRNLQDQLVQKDLPALLAATGWPVRAHLLKGRANYLCLWRWQGEVAQTLAQLPGDDRLELAKVAFWLQRTESGERSELQIDSDLWSRLEASAEMCSGERCAAYRDCYFFAARRRAELAHLVIVNHALLLSDAASGQSVLPPFEHLIVDEAHGLDAAATEHLGGHLALRDVRRRGQRASALGGASCRDAQRGVQEHLGAAAAAVRAQFPGRREVRLRPEFLAGASAEPLRQSFSALVLALADLAHAAEGIALAAGEHQQAELRAIAESARRDMAFCNEVLLADPAQVVWCEVPERDEPSFRTAPLYPGDLLQETLFGRLRAAVLTSATLAVGDDFRFLLQPIGLEDDPRVHRTILPTPFFFRDQCTLLVPTDLPEPKDPLFDTKAQAVLLQALATAGGRALVLFTAHRQLRAFANALREPLEASGLRLLAQGIDGSRSRLLDALRQDERVVVFGAQSFWEGVDVVGSALALVVLVKLPFQPPDRPVWEARQEAVEAQGRSSFNEISLPDAALRLKQGFGRLIRSTSDQGAVLVLDRRLAAARYSGYLLDALPDAQRVIGDTDEVIRQLGRCLP